ncbi:MAG TPA: hypothetical protein VFL79_00185 [Terriglobia bacterium]|nr:hypothetical protein [Terriglobia bacterium]
MLRRIGLLLLIAGLASEPLFARQRWAPDSAMLKTSQKRQLLALKLKQRYARESLRDSRLPKAVRTQLRHQLDQERKKLRQEQKEERQSVKDREKLLNLGMKQLESE